MTEILASLDDINGNLDGEQWVADDDNTALLQISVARIIRGYLSRVIDNGILLGWNAPETTPELIREAAGKIIAAQLYFNFTAKTSSEITENSFAQKRYDEGMAILTSISEGTTIIPDLVLVNIESMSTLDFFPVDDTDRAFRLGMEL